MLFIFNCAVVINVLYTDFRKFEANEKYKEEESFIDNHFFFLTRGNCC